MKVSGRRAITAALIVAAVAVSVVIVACSVDDNVDNALPTGVSASDKGSLTLTATKRTLTADEVDSTGLLAVLKDNNGRGIAAEPIVFSTDMPDLRFLPGEGAVAVPQALSKAVLSPETYTDSGGRASIKLIAGTTPGSATVFAHAPTAYNIFPAQVLIKLTDVDAVPSEGPLQINPTSVTFSEADGGETANFVAFGGDPPYVWSHTFDGCGSLSPAPDNTARDDKYVYTVATPAVSCSPDTILVRDSAGASVTATVSVSLEAAEPLSVSPPLATITLASTCGTGGDQPCCGVPGEGNQTVTFTASGGAPSYTWSVSSGGTIVPSGDTVTALFTVSNTPTCGSHTVTVTDGDADTVNVVVIIN